MAVKAAVWLVILLSFAGGGYWMLNEMTRDTGYAVGYAISGEPGALRLEVLTPLSMVQFDRPDVDDNGSEDWAGWLREHYTLKDSTGAAVEFTRLGLSTTAIGQAVAEKSNAEFIVGAPVRQGETYTLEVVPAVTEGKNYKHAFTAEPKAYAKVNFLPNG